MWIESKHFLTSCVVGWQELVDKLKGDRWAVCDIGFSESVYHSVFGGSSHFASELVTTIDKPFISHLGHLEGEQPHLEDFLTIGAKHLLNGMILQVVSGVPRGKC